MPNIVEAASSALQTLCLQHRCEHPITQEEINDAKLRFGLTPDQVRPTVAHPMWNKLYYGEQPKRAREHLTKLAKDFPKEAAIFAPAVDALLDAIAKAEVERAQVEQALQERRKARADRTAKREELGVDLRSRGGEIATEATFTALYTGLKPIEEGIRGRLIEIHTQTYQHMLATLEKADWSPSLAFPYTDRKTGAIVPDRCSLPDDFHAYFKIEFAARTGKVGRLPNVTPAAIIAVRAAQEAKAEVCGFAAKLAGKVDSELAEKGGGAVQSLTCSGDMWTNSVLTVATDKGVQTWHTQIILNRSCLGKYFNQWPTRRIEQHVSRNR